MAILAETAISLDTDLKRLSLYAKSIGNFFTAWVEVPQKGLILVRPRHNAVPVSWNNATFLTAVSG
ncbi:MAG: hypothetical protein ACFWT5_06065 [Pseudomonas helleri]|jgi:hypothetical protein